MHGDRLIHRERFFLENASQSLRILQSHSPTPYHASAIIASPHLAIRHGLRAQILALDSPRCRMAASFLEDSIVTVRLLATDSPALRSGIATLRKLTHSVLNRPVPHWRKL